MESKKPEFMLVDEIGGNTWYVYKLNIYEFPDSNWVLGETSTQQKKDAMRVCRGKAERLVRILNEQIDEEGYSSHWKMEEVKE